MLLEEERRRNAVGTNADAVGYRVTGERTKSADAGSKKCPHCGREPHPEKECWNLHPELKPVWSREKRAKKKNKTENNELPKTAEASYVFESLAFASKSVY